MRSPTPRKAASPAANSRAAAPPSEPSTPTRIVFHRCALCNRDQRASSSSPAFTGDRGGRPVPPKTTSRSITSKPLGRPCERDAGGDHADVAEGLGEVAGEVTGGGVDLLGQQSERARPGAQRRVDLRGLFELALARQILDEPEAAQHERAFVAGNAVRGLLVQVAVQKAAAGR